MIVIIVIILKLLLLLLLLMMMMMIISLSSSSSLLLLSLCISSLSMVEAMRGRLGAPPQVKLQRRGSDTKHLAKALPRIALSAISFTLYILCNIYIYIYTHISLSIYIYIYIYIYIHIHRFMHVTTTCYILNPSHRRDVREFRQHMFRHPRTLAQGLTFLWDIKTAQTCCNLTWASKLANGCVQTWTGPTYLDVHVVDMLSHTLRTTN